MKQIRVGRYLCWWRPHFIVCLVNRSRKTTFLSEVWLFELMLTNWYFLQKNRNEMLSMENCSHTHKATEPNTHGTSTLTTTPPRQKRLYRDLNLNYYTTVTKRLYSPSLFYLYNVHIKDKDYLDMVRYRVRYQWEISYNRVRYVGL